MSRTIRTLALVSAVALALGGCMGSSDRMSPLEAVATLERAMATEDFDRAASLFSDSFWLVESLFDPNPYSDDDGVALVDVLSFNGILLDWKLGACRQVEIAEGTQVLCPDGTVSGALLDVLGIDRSLPAPARFTVSEGVIVTFVPDRDELEARPDSAVTVAAFEELFAFLDWVADNAPDAEELFVPPPHLVAVSEATAHRLLELAERYAE